MKLIPIILLAAITTAAAQVPDSVQSAAPFMFQGLTLRADSVQRTPGVTTYADTLGNRYEHILMRRRPDGNYTTQDQRLFIPIGFANVTDPRLGLIMQYLALWTALDTYLNTQAQLMRLQREVK